MKHRIAFFLTAIALGVLVPATARADRLDMQLNKEMPRIIDYLKDKGYKNVGILRFRVQKGNRDARFDNAPLNGNLASRLENLLVIHVGPGGKPAFGVIHDAGNNAAAQKVGSWFSNRAERMKLFDIQLPLAWGSSKVNAEAFLSGTVKTSADLKKTTVMIGCFDRANPTLKQVHQFTIATDRNLVRDLGYSWTLTAAQRKALVARRSDDNLDDGIIESGKGNEGRTDQEKPRKSQPGQASPASIAGIELKMMVDGKEWDIREAGAGGDGPRWQLECPPPGKKIVFLLKNTSSKRLGVVVKLNGVSTVNQQTEASEGCRKWVIPAGKTYDIDGFYMLGQSQAGGTEDEDGTESRGSKRTQAKKPTRKKTARRGDDDEGPKNDEKQGQEKDRGGKPTVLPFKVLIGDDARKAKAQMGDKAGLIEIDVFAEGPTRDVEEGKQVSAKGLPPSREKAARRSYKALRTALLKNAKLKTSVAARGGDEVIIPDETRKTTGGPVKEVDFSGYSVGHLVIKVLPSEKGPQGDDLN
jgi:hypothetical protein